MQTKATTEKTGFVLLKDYLPEWYADLCKKAARAGLDSAAKEFDRKHDTGEIDPNEIPF